MKFTVNALYRVRTDDEPTLREASSGEHQSQWRSAMDRDVSTPEKGLLGCGGQTA